MEVDNIYKKYKLKQFYNTYNTDKNDLLENDHTYFRYLCFKYVDFIKHIKLSQIKKNSDFEAVLIEYRSFPHLEFLIRNAIFKLGSKWSHTIVCGNLNYKFMLDMCKNINTRIKVIKTDYDNLMPSDYSKLLTSTYFWNLFTGNKILIYQEDSCIFENNIDDFIHFDYIGAPFHKRQNDTPNCVGNGGLSLRTKDIMIKIINFISVEDTIFNYSTLEYMKNNNLHYPPEDIYFSKNMQDNNIGVVADWNSAYLFSCEGINNPNSFAGHKFWLGNKLWKKKMRHLYNLNNYHFGNDIQKYLKFINKHSHQDLTAKIPNAFDIDLFFYNKVNNLNNNNNNENKILTSIKNTGMKGNIYHPKQIVNLYPEVTFYKFLNEICIAYKINLYSANEFVKEFIYNKSYDEMRDLIIKKKFENINKDYSLLILVFIGNENVGLNLMNKLIEYKKIQNFNISFCFNSAIICKNFKNFIKKNFTYYMIYVSKDLGTDITPTMLMYDDISENNNFEHIIKLHTKSISDAYNELTDYLLSTPLSNLLKKKNNTCNCIGHENYYIKMEDDIYNKLLLENSLKEVDIKKTFVGGTIFYSKDIVFKNVINFIKKNNYKSYLLNNLYENNSINLDFSPIHFLERLFGIIHL